MQKPKKLAIKRQHKSGWTYDVVCANVEDEPETGKFIFIDCDTDLRVNEAEELSIWLTNAVVWAKQPSRKKKLLEIPT